MNTIAVLSGKGGVGKSTVAVNLAVTLSQQQFRVGLLDADIHGPSVPVMLSLDKQKAFASDEGIIPLTYGTLQVMSIGLLLEEKDDAVIWRGPMKMQFLRQMAQEVRWGELDYLVIDAPPGTGDEPLSICQLYDPLAGAVVVTTPQKLSAVDVRRCITFCRKAELPVLGLIENMNMLICPSCGEAISLFPHGSSSKTAEEMHVPFLGSIPFSPEIARMSDDGIPAADAAGPAKEIFQKLTEYITEGLLCT